MDPDPRFLDKNLWGSDRTNESQLIGLLWDRYNMLKQRFDVVAGEKRNATIAGNVAKIFISNGRIPVTLCLGLDHFGARKEINSMQEELKIIGCSYIVLMPHALTLFEQKHRTS